MKTNMSMDLSNNSGVTHRKPFIHGLTISGLESALVENGFQRYRARQIWNALYRGPASDWTGMPGLPAELKAWLAKNYDITPVSPTNTDGFAGGRKETVKAVLSLRDSERIETVIIPSDGKGSDGGGRQKGTVCVSSQVGCRFACAFCASCKAGFVRNLEPGEIIGQIIESARALGRRPDNVVFMGVGEPLDNYENVLAAIRIINHPDGLAIGARKITISTCGLIPGIQRLAKENLQIELSVSLHSYDNTTRSKLMPINRKYPVKSLLETCKQYSATTGRIITFEYIPIRGLNDSPGQAEELAKELNSIGMCRVNIIPLSFVEEFGQTPATDKSISTFANILRKNRINVTIRRSKGSNIDAACGQLRIRSPIRG